MDRSNPENRSRYHIFKNVATGQMVISDGWAKRRFHMNARIFGWANQMKREKVYYKMLSLTYDVFGTVIDSHSWVPNDIRDFNQKFLRYLAREFPGIKILGYAWGAEIQPVSKHVHYHLYLATDRRVGLNEWEVAKMWGRGFIDIKVGRSPFYLCSYLKKKDQGDYYYFPYGCRAFSVWISPAAGGGMSRLRLRWENLKEWQQKYLLDHSENECLNLALLVGIRAPPSDWTYQGSYCSEEYAKMKASELGGGLEEEKKE